MSRNMLFVVLVSMVIKTVSFVTPVYCIKQKYYLSSTTSSKETVLSKPKWAGGGDIVSDLVNGLISIKPLFAVMKVAARTPLISTAEKKGVPWRARAAALAKEKSSLQQFYDQVENKEITYPFYYTQEFHAYDEGNLNWDAAYECESATLAMALRVYPKESLTAEEAQDRLRYSVMDTAERYYQNVDDSSTVTNGGSGSQSSDSKGNGLADLAQNFLKSFTSKSPSASPKKIIDIGCSVGVSTFYWAEKFRQATVIDALDLSPYFLAVAKQRQNYVASVASSSASASSVPSASTALGESVNQGLQKFVASGPSTVLTLSSLLLLLLTPSLTYIHPIIIMHPTTFHLLGLGRIRWLHGNAEVTQSFFPVD